MLSESIRDNTLLETISYTDAFDPFYSLCRHTDSLPNWLQLQQEIREQLNSLMVKLGTENAQFTTDLQALNANIAAYNESVPSKHMRKSLIHLDCMEDAFDSWQ